MRVMRHVKPEVRCHFLDDLNRNAAQLSRVSCDQRILANGIDQARNAPGMPVNFADGFMRENQVSLRVCSRHLQPAPHVAAGFVPIQRLQPGPQRDPLFQLAKFGQIQFFVQFRLTDEQDLQQFLLRGFQVREQSYFFQNFRGEMMGLVHHQHGTELALMSSDQELAKLKQQVALGLSRGRQPEISRYELQELQRNSSGC